MQNTNLTLSADEQRFLQAESVSLDTSAQPNTPWPCYLCLKLFKIKDMRKHVARHILAAQLGINDPEIVLTQLVSMLYLIIPAHIC